MALKEDWKNTGKGIGGVFKNFGKAIATTAKVAVGKEENEVGEDGRTALRSSWSKVGHGFGDAGKSLGKAAKNTAKAAVGEGEKNETPKTPDESEVVDVESKEVKEEK